MLGRLDAKKFFMQVLRHGSHTFGNSLILQSYHVNTITAANIHVPMSVCQLH